MKRALATALIGCTMLVGTALPAKADRVYCRATLHRVTCYNTTPYYVDVRLAIRTTYSTLYRAFTIYGDRRSVYVGPTIRSIRWRWNFS